MAGSVFSLPHDFRRSAGWVLLLAGLLWGTVLIDAAAGAHVASPQPPADSPLEARLLADAADGRWDDFTLLGAALVASGVNDPKTLQRYEAQVAGLVHELSSQGGLPGPPCAKARAILEFMHRRILVGGYAPDATDLTLALDQGRFNCVSASVLFEDLAERFGLSVRGVELAGHTMSRLIVPGQRLDIQTTCPSWFQALDAPEAQAELVQATPGKPLREEQATPRELSKVALVATIYYNRGVERLGRRRFAEAAAANVKALRLDPASTAARGNLVATLNNWAIDLSAQGRHAEAMALLRQGLAIDPVHAALRINAAYLRAEWMADLSRQGRLRETSGVAGRTWKTAPGAVGAPGQP